MALLSYSIAFLFDPISGRFTHRQTFSLNLISSARIKINAMTISRRKFIGQSACITAGSFAFANSSFFAQKEIMTVNGWMPSNELGFSLSHEHVMVDFIGADKIDPSRYDAAEVFNTALPVLLAA